MKAQLQLQQRHVVRLETRPPNIEGKGEVLARDLVKNANDGQAKKDYVDCQATTPNVLGEQRWIVNLEFDADGTLSDAGVAIWNIFL